MKVIAGLGNPGKKYEKMRHNLGFRVIDAFAKTNGFPDFKLSKKFNVLLTKKKFHDEKIVLAKPKTFMNVSGKLVKSLTTNYKIPTTNLWVVHDDVDLPLGKIKIIKNRSAAGHKGVQSIIDKLKTKNFIRFRVGIRPKIFNLKPEILKDFVLQKFNKKEEKLVKEVIEKTVEAIAFSLKEGIEKAMNEFNNGKADMPSKACHK